MLRKGRISAAIALCSAVASVGLVGCEEDAKSDSDASASASPSASDRADETERSDGKELVTGTQKIKSGDRSVNVSCSGGSAEGGPVIVLLHGGGDNLKKMSGLQKALSERNRVCSYDRLGAGASDKPDGPQTMKDVGRVLTDVLDRAAGDAPVVLAGHSLGGLISARYAPDHQDRIRGMVLMDATSPTQIADLEEGIPESAKGPAGEVRTQSLSVLRGGKPELLTLKDGKVRSAGDIPVEVVQHGKPYLAALPKYGPGLERAWGEGQRKWLAVSTASRLSTAEKSGHHIYVDQPDLAVQKIQHVAGKAAS